MAIVTLMYVKCRVFHGLFDFFHCNIQHREGLNYHLNKTHGLHGHFTYIEEDLVLELGLCISAI